MRKQCGPSEGSWGFNLARSRPVPVRCRFDHHTPAPSLNIQLRDDLNIAAFEKAPYMEFHHSNWWQCMGPSRSTALEAKTEEFSRKNLAKWPGRTHHAPGWGRCQFLMSDRALFTTQHKPPTSLYRTLSDTDNIKVTFSRNPNMHISDWANLWGRRRLQAFGHCGQILGFGQVMGFNYRKCGLGDGQVCVG